MLRQFCLATALALSPLSVAALPLGPFTDLLVFGDSLSDPGNAFVASGGTIPSPLLFPNGQFTDGDVWSTQLGADVTSGKNFAFGGAKAQTDFDLSPDLALQRLAFQGTAPTLGARPLAAIFIGANDVRDATPFTLNDLVTDTVSAITLEIGNLIDTGLEDFLIFGLPNLGRLPEAISLGIDDFARNGTLAYNAALKAALVPLRQEARIRYFDTFGFFETFADAAEASGVNVLDTCLNNFPICNATNAGAFLWIDDVHPTEDFHTALARAVSVELVPLPGGFMLLLTGIGVASVMRRRLSSSR